MNIPKTVWIWLIAVAISCPLLKAEQKRWNGLPAVILSNDAVRIVILPDQGGSLVSLYSLKNQKEWLWILPHKRSEWKSRMPSAYELSGGIEDSFPTLGASSSPDIKTTLPFFGSVWNKSWKTEFSSPDSFTCTYKSKSPAYTLSKSWSLSSSKVAITYHLTNTGNHPFHSLWVAHALFQMDRATQLDLPSGTELRVHSWLKAGKERYGGQIKWPTFDLETPSRDINKLSTKTTGRSDKLYITRWKSKQITLSHSDGSSLKLHFGAGIKSVGLWLNQKAFPFEGEKYSIVGIEPSTSAFESLEEAHRNKQALVLQPGQSTTWNYSIECN